MAEINGNGIEAKTPWGTIVAKGQQVILIVCLMALGAVIYRENDARQKEHEVMMDRIGNLRDHFDLRGDRLRAMIRAGDEYQNVLMRSICRNTSPSQMQYQCDPKYFGYEEEMINREIGVTVQKRADELLKQDRLKQDRENNNNKYGR